MWEVGILIALSGMYMHGVCMKNGFHSRGLARDDRIPAVQSLDLSRVELLLDFLTERSLRAVFRYVRKKLTKSSTVKSVGVTFCNFYWA